MKTFLLFISFSLIIISTSAQSASAEAKAAYLLAEEEFSAGKYASCISYLDQAAAKFGGPNAKILYLKIMALEVLAEDDDASLEALKKTIAAFSKAPDYDSFNEEKQLEVMKLKLRLEKEGASGKPIDPLEASAYTKMGITGWKVGVKVEAMQEAHPDFFAKARKTAGGDTMAMVSYDVAEQNFTVFVMKGLVFSISKSLVPVNTKDDASFSKSRNIVADLNNHFGGNPVETVTNSDSPPSKWATISLVSKGYAWNSRKIQVIAAVVNTATKRYKQPTSFDIYAVLSVSYIPK